MFSDPAANKKVDHIVPFFFSDAELEQTEEGGDDQDLEENDHRN